MRGAKVPVTIHAKCSMIHGEVEGHPVPLTSQPCQKVHMVFNDNLDKTAIMEIFLHTESLLEWCCKCVSGPYNIIHVM